MAKYIEVGQDVIEFPDEMTDAEIEKVLSSQLGGPTPKEPPVQQTQQEPNMADELGRQLGLTARAGLTGLSSLGTLFADPLTAIYNVGTGSNIPLPSATVQELLTKAGLPEPSNTLERSVQAGGAAMTNVAGTAKALPNVLSGIFSKELAKQIPAAAGAGMASQAAAEQAQQEGWGVLPTFGVSLLAGAIGGVLGSQVPKVQQWAGNTKFGQKLGMLAAEKPLTIDDVKGVARSLYKSVDDSGVTVRSNDLVKSLDTLEGNLKNYSPSTDTHRQVAGTLNDMRKDIANKGTNIPFSELEGYRKTLSNLARQSSDDATAEMARQALKAFDDMVPNLKPHYLNPNATNFKDVLSNVRDARAAWRRVSNAETVDDLVYRAKIMSDGSNGRLDLGTSLQNEFKKFAKNKDNLTGFSKQEIEQIVSIARGHIGQDFLAQVSRFDPRKAGLGSAITYGTTVVNPQAGIGLAASSVLSEKMLTSIKMNAVKKLQQDILSGKVSKTLNTKAMQALIQSYIQAEQEIALKEAEKNK